MQHVLTAAGQNAYMNIDFIFTNICLCNIRGVRLHFFFKKMHAMRKYAIYVRITLVMASTNKRRYNVTLTQRFPYRTWSLHGNMALWAWPVGPIWMSADLYRHASPYSHEQMKKTNSFWQVIPYHFSADTDVHIE